MESKSLEAGLHNVDDKAMNSPSLQQRPSSSSTTQDDGAAIEKVYKKLDRRILPAFWMLYFICSGIRSNVGLSQTMNQAQGHSLPQVLKLSPKEISTGLALFYVCYVIFDCPSNLIMSRVSPQVWMSRIVLSTGIIGACMAGIRAAWSLYLLRLLMGIVIAGMWPGMTYYLTLFYPPSRLGKRIGRYFTASQVSAAVVGLVSAGFQLMDGAGGLFGWQWMFLLWGLVGVILGIGLLWWLPERPLPPGTPVPPRSKWYHYISPRPAPALKGEDAEVHYHDLEKVYHSRPWNVHDLLAVLKDWRLWPLTIMYFGVVGVGIGTQSYGTVIIQSINPNLTGVQLSLLFAPIWICDLIAILLITPVSDYFPSHLGRALFFIFPVLLQITGLIITTFTPNPWSRYFGLLLIGFGLGPTVPVTMTWTSQIFQPRHGQVGVAAASALVSGLGNLGSILTTYALYAGWADDSAGRLGGPGSALHGRKFAGSNLVMVGILGGSLIAALGLVAALRIAGDGTGDVRRRVRGTATATTDGGKGVFGWWSRRRT